MSSPPDLHPQSLIDLPPKEMIPNNLSEALVAIGKLQVTCQNQEDKLEEQDEKFVDRDKKIDEQAKRIASLERVISTANGARLALYWIGALIVGAATVWGVFPKKGN